MGRPVLLVLCGAVVALLAAGRASAATRQDLSLRMSDGVRLAATLYEPSSAPPPAGYPAIVLFHALGSKRQDLDPVARRFSDRFAVLAFDERGQGQSGGLASLDGPREVADAREIFSQLAARSDIDGAKIGAWGISLGGGAVLRSVAEGVPWAAAETVETWSDLYSALAPQNLAKSGAIFQFLNEVPPNRLDPTVLAIRDDALAGRNLPALRAWCELRSSRKLLSKVKTPVYLFQGRRDFAFDIAQAKAAYRLLKGPKRLYVGDFGHAPSTFPGPDFGQMIALGHAWFARYLLGTTAGVPPVALAPNPWHGKPRTYTKLPATRTLAIPLPGSDRLAGAGRALRTSGRFTGRAETFGSATVRVTARLSGGWSRLVAVLTAQRRSGGEVIVSEGGVNTTGLKGKRRLTIRLIDTATLIPEGARLRLTLASSSLAQSPGNLLYLNLPMPRKARLSLGGATLALPILRKPVSR